MPVPSLDGSDRAAPPSLARSDCSSIGAVADLDAFSPRSGSGEARRHGSGASGGGGEDSDAATPRLQQGCGVMPQFTCVSLSASAPAHPAGPRVRVLPSRPYVVGGASTQRPLRHVCVFALRRVFCVRRLQPYLKSYVLHSQLKASLLHGGPRRAAKRPVSAPASGMRHVVVINGMRYVPAGPAAAPSDVDALRPRRAANRKLQMSRTFTDFSSPSKGPMEVGSPERMQNQIRTRPWTAQPAARPWTASAPSPDAAGDSAQGAGGWHGRSDAAASSRAGGADAQTPAPAGAGADGASHHRGLAQPASRTAPGHERRRPSSALPSSPGGHHSRDALRLSPREQAVATAKRPSSAGFAQPLAVAGIFRGPDSRRRPVSANRIRFDSDRMRASQGGAAAPVVDGGIWQAGGPSQRPSSATSRPSSASARRQLQQETESITRYSQDPIHPERMEVTYVTRQKQREDSRMDIQYDDIAIDQSEARGDEEEGALAHYYSQSQQSHPPRQAPASRPSSALARPLSASSSLDPARSRMRPGTPQSAGSRLRGAMQSGAVLAQDALQPRHQDLPGGEEVAGSGASVAAGGGGRTGARGRPSTAPAHERRHERWEHRMERIWEKRFSNFRAEGDSSQDSADSARSEYERGGGAGGDKSERVRPWSAAPGPVPGRVAAPEQVGSRYPDSREMMQLRRQMRVIEDVQRDLDLRMVPNHTGISHDDSWLRGAQRATNPSKACVVQ